MMEKRFWIVMHGHIIKLADEEDLIIVKSRKAAIKFCEEKEENGDPDWEFFDVKANGKTPEQEIKRMVLEEAEAW